MDGLSEHDHGEKAVSQHLAMMLDLAFVQVMDTVST